MNMCLGITQDKDVRHIRTRVSKDVLEKFHRGEELNEDERPRAKPMLLDYEGGRTSSWNHLVWEEFKPILLAEESKLVGPKYQLFPNEKFARGLFMSRVMRLRGYVNELKARRLPGGKKETKEQVKARINQTDEFRRDESRDNTRRAEVTSLYSLSYAIQSSHKIYQNWQMRLRITTSNMYNGNGTIDKAWEWLFMLVDILGRDGASSDESEPEDDRIGLGAKVCRVKIRRWRAKWLDPLLTLIDQDRNITNQYGNYQAGNRPRLRKRPGRNTSLDKWVPPGLPINFYDEDWYSNLSQYHKSELAATEPFPILDIVRDTYT